MDDDETFRELVDRFSAAINNGDRAAIKELYADDIVSCDALPPLCSAGRAVAEERLDDWMDEYEGGMGCEIAFGAGAAGDGVGYCHFLERITGRRVDGSDVDMWVRVTWCLKSDNGQWRIRHQHMSDPFDPDSGKVRLDLTP